MVTGVLPSVPELNLLCTVYLQVTDVNAKNRRLSEKLKAAHARCSSAEQERDNGAGKLVGSPSHPLHVKDANSGVSIEAPPCIAPDFPPS